MTRIEVLRIQCHVFKTSQCLLPQKACDFFMFLALLFVNAFVSLIFKIFQIGNEVHCKSTLRKELFLHSPQHGNESKLGLAIFSLSPLNKMFGLQFILSYLE